MRTWRIIYSLMLVLGILAAMFTDENDVRAQSLPTAILNRENHETEIKTTPADLKTTLLIKDSAFTEAYFDVVSILRERNSCSDFFGNSNKALEVFNQLAGRMTRTYIPSNVGIRMSGDYTIWENQASGNRYRIFPRAEINYRGSFYGVKTFAADPFVPPVGSFYPNTREARVLMLLHELGHLIEVRPGQWLLPDDGRNSTQSMANTRVVEKQCAAMIRDLGKPNVAGMAQSKTPGQN